MQLRLELLHLQFVWTEFLRTFHVFEIAGIVESSGWGPGKVGVRYLTRLFINKIYV